MLQGNHYCTPGGYSSISLQKYQYHKDSGKYDNVVLVPNPKYQGQMSSNRQFHRQPTEHPNDRPEHPQSPTEPYVLSETVRSLSLNHRMEPRNPSSPQQNEEMQRCHQRVWDWKQADCSANDDESFVMDSIDSTDSASESYGGGADYHRSISEQNSSDEDTGLQKSLSGIQAPPVDGHENASLCSRQSSNGSHSSLDSSLSFHTVYPSEGFRKPKPEASAHQPRHQPQNHSQPHQQNTGATVPKSHPTVSTEPYFARSQSTSEGPRPSGQTGVQQINRNADQASPEATSVFITYAEEQQNSGFKRLVLQLTKTLLSNGIKVRLDMLESTLMSMSVSSWLDDNIQKCDFVIICVSPSYKLEVEQQVLPDSSDPHSLHTRYIYNRLLTEYIQNGSRNYRFIPVLIGGATRRDLPSLCLDTNVYEWPKQYEAIIYRLFRKEKYVQPKVGAPPRVTVETYGTHDDMASGR